MLFLVKLFQIYEHSPFRCKCRGQERRIHSSEPNHVFKYIFHRWHPYCLQVALCLHLESPLSRFPPHSMACLRSDGTTGSGLASSCADMIYVPVTNELMMWLRWLSSGISK